MITRSAQHGIYIVYLINPKLQTISLSLNQGATEVFAEFGQRRGREVLKRRAIDIRDRVPEFAKNFSTEPIKLSSKQGLPLGYEAGHAFGRTYFPNATIGAEFADDLQQMFEAYQSIVNRGGLLPTEAMQEEANSGDIEETRNYILSQRIERNASVRTKVLNLKAPVCECCGLDPHKHYGFDGAADELPLDVHHARPLNTLSEGEVRRYKIPDDFLVLCPTCHRMIHKQADTSDLRALRRKVLFTLQTNLNYRND